VFVTAAYTFRLVFMAFHGEPRFDPSHPPHESPLVVTVPLVLLAIPSIGAGWWIGDIVFSDFIRDPGVEFHGLASFMLHGVTALPFWLAVAGMVVAGLLYGRRTDLPKRIAMRLGPLYAVVERKYGFDELYAWLFGAGARALGTGLWKAGDQTFIDGLAVNGSARLVGWVSGVVRLAQTGILNTYAVLMLFGILAGVTWVIWRFSS
jgi:NADH-quinone oxidoreductase subunit L